ncbi:PHD finger protein 20-like isoform X2 [Hypanus sabinus]|uniref:PHD finger protein 20-like isoform X2 n=1 Tax=Hypanus sabinus TaxID=79690 RepID=UPI0028C4BE99|nr:PHD finger protein 20-like isoform X2 [Hypanus sabinus]
MSKKPPSRRGITFEVGARLEARDRLKKWYTAHIEKIDYEEGKVLIHFKRWNHRYDEWFSWDSVYLRPLERPLLRKEGAKLDEPTVEFRPSEQVLACWSDCRFYPAKVISVNKDASYTVEFYDGVVQNVKKIHVKSIPKSSREKNAASGRNKENGSGGGRRRERFRKSSPSLVGQQTGEGKLAEKDGREEEAKPVQKEMEQGQRKSPQELAAEPKTAASSLPPGTPPPAPQPQKPEEKRKRGRPPSSGHAGSHSKGAASQDRRLLPSRQGGTGTGKRKCASAASMLSKQMKFSKASDQGPPTGSQGQNRRRSLRLASGDSNPSTTNTPSDGVEPRGKAKEPEKAEEAAAASEPPAEAQQAPAIQARCSPEAPATPSAPEVAAAAPEPQAKEAAKADSPEPSAEPREAPPEAAPVVKRVPRSQNPNRYITNAAQSPEEQLPPKALIIDLDHNKFKCKIAECSKAFRKAKMLHYHMKYYHGIEKAESEQGSPKRSMQTRGSCPSETESLLDSPKRRRTTSGSLHGSQSTSQRDTPSSSVDLKAAKLNEKRRISAPSSLELSAQTRLSLRDKSKDNQVERSHRRLQDRERGFVDSGTKERTKEKKLRDFLKVKLKKKKKKKKKVKSVFYRKIQKYSRVYENLYVKTDKQCAEEDEVCKYKTDAENMSCQVFEKFSDSEENIDVSRDYPPKKSTFLSTRSSSSYKFPFSHKYTSLCSSDSGYHMDGLKFDDVSDDDPTSDSSTDSLLWSDDDYNQDVDVTTNPDDTGDGEDSQLEIVRCICEVEEENEFMIQCEECLCWQHGVCMGLLEDSVPEIYTCYMCRDPPEHRLSSRYWYDKEWLASGHMHGLAFLKENYSHQNSGKIVATHQLLGDVHKVIELLHGLQLKIYILQNKDQPDLKLWCKPWHVSPSTIEKLWERHLAPSEDSNSGLSTSTSTQGRTPNGTAERQAQMPVIEESYITSEHCYQKPRAYYPAAEQRLVVETRNSSLDEGFGRMRENGDEALAERFGRNVDEDSGRTDFDLREQDSLCKGESGTGKVRGTESTAEVQNEESRGPKESEEGGDSDPQLQWQVNLLAHIESLQDEVCHRMDFIERELDVLESWLDYSGELEPPDPLARLPQLKNRMKQLLADLGKVQQIASYCPV